MLVNLTEVLLSQGKVRTENIPLEMEELICEEAVYPILQKSQIEFQFTNTGTLKALIEGKIDLVLEIPCDRCLQSVKEPMSLTFEHEVMASEMTETISETDVSNFMEGYTLNVEDLIKSEMIINLPTKVLCKEECKGICLLCGQNLNEKECGCDTFVPDPRMAAIKDIFNANKEV